MKSLNKGVFFIILIVVLGTIVAIKGNFFRFHKSLQLTNRLPESEYLVRINALPFSKEINNILVKYNLPIREFASPDFLLSQAKQHGVNIQSKSYMFFNKEMDEWGVLMAVNDSSKIINAIDRFRKNTSVQDSSDRNVRIFNFTDLNMKVLYDKTFLFIYSGKAFKKRMNEVMNPKEDVVRPQWKRFLQKKTFVNENVVIYTEGDDIHKWGFDYALFSHNNDTTQLLVKAYLYSKTPHGIVLKNKAQGLPISSSDNKRIELHISPTIKNTPTGIAIMGKLNDLGKKISFPTTSFFKAWEGDLSFREGGIVNSTQRIITTEFDENFNAHEVIKLEPIQVPGYSVAFNTNKHGEAFINTLFAKGLLRSEEGKMRFLFSPLLMMKHKEENYFFTSSTYFSPLIDNPGNQLTWRYEGTPFTMNFGQITGNSVTLDIKFPAKPLVKYFQQKKYKKSKPLSLSNKLKSAKG